MFSFSFFFFSICIYVFFLKFKKEPAFLIIIIMHSIGGKSVNTNAAWQTCMTMHLQIKPFIRNYLLLNMRVFKVEG
jgi:hypothetical protein